LTIDDVIKDIATPNTFYNSLIVRYFPDNLQAAVISEIAVAYLKNRPKMNKIIAEGGIQGYFARSIYYYATKTNLKRILNGENTISHLSSELNYSQFELEDTQDTFFEEMQEILIQTKTSFRDATIFRLVYKEGNTYREISQKYGWSPSTISRSIQKSILLIQSKV
jgi:RNA polymerase sigma factor (sigma-70 family)